MSDIPTGSKILGQPPAPSAAVGREAPTARQAPADAAEQAAATQAAELLRLLQETGIERGTKARAQVPETHLEPVSPPAVAFTQELREGAKAFANSIQALDLSDFGRMELRVDEDAPGAAEVHAAIRRGKTKSEREELSLGRLVRGDIPERGPVREQWDATVERSRQMSEAEATEAIETLAEGFRQLGLGEATAETLIAIFLKLNMKDPNNSPEMQLELHGLMTKMRKAEIKMQIEKNQDAQEMIDKAKKKAERIGIFAKVLSILMIVVSVALTVLTFGATAGLLVCAAIALGALISASVAASKGKTGKDLGDAILQGASWASLVTIVIPIGAGLIAFAHAARQTAAQMMQQLANLLAQQSSKAVSQSARQSAQEAIKASAQQSAKAAGKLAEEGAKRSAQASRRWDFLKTGAVGKNEIVAKWMNIGTYLSMGGLSVGRGVIEHRAALDNIAASQFQIEAKEHARLAELYQELLEEMSTVMEQIQKAKNDSVEVVLKMMAGLFGTRLKQLSAAMTGLR